jgi:hypothetical protein
MSWEPAPEGDADAKVEGVCQGRGVSVRSKEIREETSCAPNASGCAQLQQQSYSRKDTGNGRRQPIVDVESAEDEQPWASPEAKVVRDNLAGSKEGDRTERAGIDGAGSAPNKLGPRLPICRGMSHLHGSFHRSRSVERSRVTLLIASSRLGGAGVQS